MVSCSDCGSEWTGKMTAHDLGRTGSVFHSFPAFNASFHRTH